MRGEPAPPEKLARLGDVLDFMRMLWAVDHGLQSTSKRMETTLGVTGPQRLVIRIVGRSPGISAGELADIMHVHPSTLTGILKRLEARGLINRRPDPEDARRALFVLTAKGKEVDAMRTGTVEAAVRRALARLSQDQIATAGDVLMAVSAELAKDQ
jgi:DNA-binding MarR family transcriptional regulator